MLILNLTVKGGQEVHALLGASYMFSFSIIKYMAQRLPDELGVKRSSKRFNEISTRKFH